MVSSVTPRIHDTAFKTAGIFYELNEQIHDDVTPEYICTIELTAYFTVNKLAIL